MDSVYLLLMLVFFAVSVALVYFCETLGGAAMSWVNLLSGLLALEIFIYLLLDLIFTVFLPDF